MIRRAGLATLAAFAAGCASSGPPLDPNVDRDVQVFQAVIRSEACGEGKYGKYNVILDQPAPLERARISDEWFRSPQLRDEAVRQAKQREQWPHLELCAGARVVEASVVEDIFEREKTIPRSWNGFYNAFPDASALFRISAPVFAADGSAAVVYMDRTCDVLCGGGFMIELKNKKGRWRVVRREGTWIS